ncbi:hypothetical protein J6590_004501 [Homalodisca vitripennis]|nr:hypothetical protein J6590_004501 [Homalodisca vitripennis]
MIALSCVGVFPITVITNYNSTAEYRDGSLVPVCLTHALTFWPIVFFLMIISLFFLLPLVVLIILYTVIARHLMADPQTCSTSDSCNKRARRQVVMMLGTVVLSFFLCLLPFRVLTLWVVILPNSIQSMERYYIFLYFSRIMQYTNSAVNPILYNLMSSKFRHGFQSLCGCGRRARRDLLLRHAMTLTTTLSQSSTRTHHYRASPDLSWRSSSIDSRGPICSTNGSFRKNVIMRSSLLKRDSDLQAKIDNSVPESYVPILVVAEYRYAEYFDGSMVPVCLTQADSFWPAFFFLFIISLFFGLPLAILMILYSVIACHLMANPGIVAPSAHSAALRYRRQVVMMLGTVVVSFFLCLLPFRAFTLWIIIESPETVQSLGIDGYYKILYFSRIMLYLNSAVNPILYNLMSSKFRDGFRRLLGFKATGKDLLNRKGTITTTTTTVTNSSQKRLSTDGRSLKRSVVRVLSKEDRKRSIDLGFTTKIKRLGQTKGFIKSDESFV